MPDARVNSTGARLTRRDVRVRAVPAARHPHRPDRADLTRPAAPVDVHAVVYAELEDGLLLRVRAFFDVYAAAMSARRAAQARHGGRAGDADAARVRAQRVTRTGGWSDSRPRSSTSTVARSRRRL